MIKPQKERGFWKALMLVFPRVSELPLWGPFWQLTIPLGSSHDIALRRLPPSWVVSSWDVHPAPRSSGHRTELPACIHQLAAVHQAVKDGGWKSEVLLWWHGLWQKVRQTGGQWPLLCAKLKVLSNSPCCSQVLWQREHKPTALAGTSLLYQHYLSGVADCQCRAAAEQGAHREGVLTHNLCRSCPVPETDVASSAHKGNELSSRSATKKWTTSNASPLCQGAASSWTRWHHQ